jgi:hypothetical protein
MKITLITLAFALTAPLAFGQADGSARSSGPKTQVNAGPTKTGSVDSFISGRAITLTSTLLTHPARYTVAKEVQFENANGTAITADSVRPGTLVRLSFNSEGKVDRVTLLDLR